jgi:hypothetical protein
MDIAALAVAGLVVYRNISGTGFRHNICTKSQTYHCRWQIEI